MSGRIRVSLVTVFLVGAFGLLDAGQPSRHPARWLGPAIAGAQGSLVDQGRILFFEETFDGNGRTCGTCHTEADGFGLTPATIASLPAADPLFVAETNPALVALEHPPLMRGPRGLILENIDGFANPPVFRGSPHLLNIALTAPYGLSGEFPNLRVFSVGAVKQHFPKTLNRVEGVDFRLPTEDELAALEAFMQSIVFPRDQNFALERFVTTRQQRRGSDLFFGVSKCSMCHDGPVLATANAALGGGNRRFNTGVVNLPINTTPHPDNPGGGPLPQEAAGSREFDTPPMFGVSLTAPFFHDSSVATLRESVQFYALPQFNDSPGGVLVGGITLLSGQVDDITAFLNALKEYSFSVSPRLVTFGARNIAAGPTAPATVTITNNGSTPLAFTSIGVTDGEFLVVGSPATDPLPAGASRLVEIAFDPSTVGVKGANLELVTDQGEVGVALVGVGTAGMPTFVDVPAHHAAFRFIEALFSAGVTAGCSPAPMTFCPDGVLTRAQMAILLVRGLGRLDVPPRGMFSDVVPAAFGAGFIERLKELGISAGCGGKDFCPEGLVTRAQIAVFLVRALGKTPVASPGGIFADVAPGHPMAGFIERMAQLGITAGCGGGRFCPDAPVTRGEVAVLVARALGLPLP